MTNRRLMLGSLWLVLFVLSANGCLLWGREPLFWTVAVLTATVINALIGVIGAGKVSWRLRLLAHGVDGLTVFAASLPLSLIWHAVSFFRYPLEPWIWSVVVSVVIHSLLFWSGMITLYLTSVQLGLRYRVIGALCGWIPLVNLIILGIILNITAAEFRTESEKERVNAARSATRICQTRYPILLVHGVFFRDNAVLNYWGRIPSELEKNGARVFYGKHSSALAVTDSAKEIAWRVRELVDLTGCEKVNIIAHSKGGLDCRCAMHLYGIAPYVASLTTINTPHRGCRFAEHLLGVVPTAVQQKVAAAYNTAAHKLGDEEPDFLAAVRDLTASVCAETDREWCIPDGVLCQSAGSVLAKAVHGRFPMNITRGYVASFDGENDGLVSEDSFAFGESYTLLRTAGKRGISHMDMTDLNQENIPDFDVREWYVQLVHDLKKRGL